MNRIAPTTLLMLLALPTCLSAALLGSETSAARRDANRFILEKLQRQDGEGWNRSGQFFLWRYAFSSDGCELTVERQALQGGELVRQRVPVRDVVPAWAGSASLQLYCQATGGCIELQVMGSGPTRESRLSETSLLAPQPDDLPKLHDAFVELNRLCDDAYRRE